MGRQKIMCGCRQGYITCDRGTISDSLLMAYESAATVIKKKSRRERFKQLVDSFIEKVNPEFVEELSVFNRGLQINIRTKMLPVVIVWYPSTGVYVYGSKRFAAGIDELMETIHNPPETLIALYGQEPLL